MSTNADIQDDLAFEQLIHDFNEPEKFLARQIRVVQKRCSSRSTCPTFSFTRRQIATGAGGVVGIAGALYAIAEAIRAMVS